MPPTPAAIPSFHPRRPLKKQFTIYEKKDLTTPRPPCFTPPAMRKQATPEQKAAAAERRARLQSIAKQIASMPEADRLRLVPDGLATIEGHRLSVKNSALLLMQRPGVSVVGGFQQWKRAGRQVMKGEKALGMFLPIAPSKSAEDAGEPSEDSPSRPRFRVVNVFDVSQTEPATATATA